jgi:hypothetical protein
MNKMFTYCLLAIFLAAIANVAVVYGHKPDEKILASYKKDISGDRVPEIIRIIHHSNENKRELTIKSGNRKPFKIPVASGPKPSIIFQDLTQDRIKDVIICVPGRGKMVPTYQLLSFANGQLNKIPLPEELTMVAQFEKNYQASIIINEANKAYTLNLTDRRKSLERKGLYQKGNLNEPTELMVHPFESLKLVRFRDLTYGLTGRQLIDDGYGGEKIAYIDSTWKWVNGGWKLQKTSVK